MRPVNKGSWPIDTKTKAPKVFKSDRKKDDDTYKKAKPDLICRLGPYCSYCETKLRDRDLHVEHMLPKSLHPSLRGDWGNFLLACGPCNEPKSNKDIKLDDVYWPDCDNTASIFDYQFQYQESGEEIVIIKVNSNLSQFQKQKAQRTLELTALNRYPDGPDEPTPGDQRYKDRTEAWNLANLSREMLKQNDNAKMREYIVIQAKDKGFFSVWMTVFRNDPDMLKRFIKAFPGTERECFDEHNNRPKPTISRKPQQPQNLETENDRKDKPVVNPSLTQTPRYQIADVIPLQYETSILDWLERSGRLIDRTSETDESLLDSEEEIAELIENDGKYDDDDDDDILVDDD